MAEAFFKVLIVNVTNLIKKEVGLIMGVDNEMKKLANTLTTIQKVLEDAEDKQFESKAIQYWLSQLSDMAFEIEDILDDCNTEFSKLKAKGNNFLNKPKKVLYKWKVGRRIKEAAEKLEAVAKDRHNFQLTERVVQQPNQRDWRRETGSFLTDSDHVYGRDEEIDKIVDMVVNNVFEQSLCVLPIIGLGGMGKTTLAQFIFNDDRVNQHFNAKIWVCVSDHYDLKAILKAIIEVVTKKKTDLEELDSLQSRVHEELNARRYLLILDDVWNDNQEDWGILKGTMACGLMGSSVVVTTRQQKVARIMGTLPALCLTELSEEHCWLLFRQRAFGQENEQCHGYLEAIGRRIVKKCGGVPLAAKALGGLLRFERDEKEWVRVEESHMWNLPQEENSILPVLRLSYRHLPFVMKRCFAYCAVFQKDHKFEKTKLIFHWMAHGCIASNGKREVEDVGDQIWNELAMRSFFQEVYTTSEGKTTFKMHDLVHDLAQSILENKIHGAETESSSSTSASNNKVRQVRWCAYNSKIISSCIAVELSTLATITNYNRLRIIKLKRIDAEELPSGIGKLKQLRYLNLSGSSFLTLPHTICCLYNLQILILNKCKRLKCLPNNIRSMTNLRHIFLKECERLSHMPYRIGELTSLKTLSFFIVGDKIGSQLDELEHLINLGGKLEIRNLKSVKSHLIAKKANLVEKPNFRDLVLRWEGDGTSSELMEDEKVLEALEPHPNLVTLEIYGFRGRQLALWMKSIKNITRIEIRGCTNLRSLSPLGDHPHLKSLFLSELVALEYIVEENEVGCEAAKFPLLEELRLEYLPNLKGWLKEGEVVEMFPNLQYLDISDCKSLRLTSTSKGLNCVTKLKLGRCKIGSCFPEGSLWHLTALQELQIWNSTELEDGMAEEMMKHLHLLKRLLISNVHGMVCMPQGLQHIPSLQSLTLLFLKQLTSLPDWLPNLASLTQLYIVDCPEIQSLPSGIQRMTNLKLLGIWRCPQLKRRCEEPNGEEWHKISHIPHLDIQSYY